MRVISWNCCDAFERKFGHLERLGPDIAIIQEVRPESLKFAGVLDRSLWLGDTGRKGLAVIIYADWKLSPAPLSISERWFLPVVLTKGEQTIHLVAVWVDSAKDCVPPTLRALASLKDFLTSAPSIIAGDFNQTVALDKGRIPGNRFADVLAMLGSLGLRSAWHTFTGEAQGQESNPTLYWRWNEQAKYHIDFIFGSGDLEIQSATLGTFDQYVRAEISDHTPLSVDFHEKPLLRHNNAPSQVSF